jgi:hypothetical protein
MTGDEISEILVGKLYLSSRRGLNDIDYLLKTGITLIVDLSNAHPPPEIDSIKFIKFTGIVDAPSQDIQTVFHSVYSIIQEEAIFDEMNCSDSNHQGRVLVCCLHGISRSASVVLYLLMKLSKTINLRPYLHPESADLFSMYDFPEISLKTAFKYTKLQRRVILPNSGFMQQLIQEEKALFGASSLTLGPHGQLFWG